MIHVNFGVKTIVFLLIGISLTVLIQNSHADVFIPDDELVGYVDSNGIYTVVGAVRNTNDYPVLPSVYLTVSDDTKKLDVVQNLPTSFPGKDIPFKIKIPNLGDGARISDSKIEFQKDPTSNESKVAIIYDRSLTKHADGHLSGKIVNNGNQTEHDLKIYATIHGQNNSFIDVAKNIEKIEKIEPGQSLEFTMYPDPSLAKNVHYYSCFALGDETIIPLSVMRENEKFNFRYDSSAAIVANGFDKTGTSLSLTGINSFKFPTYVNFEFPKTSDDEKFTVLVDGSPITALQSADEEGNWHVAFDLAGSVQNNIVINGFVNPDKVVSYDDLRKESNSAKYMESDYSFLYYVIPIVAAGLVGGYVFLRKKTKRVV